MKEKAISELGVLSSSLPGDGYLKQQHILMRKTWNWKQVNIRSLHCQERLSVGLKLFWNVWVKSQCLTSDVKPSRSWPGRACFSPMRPAYKGSEETVDYKNSFKRAKNNLACPNSLLYHTLEFFALCEKVCSWGSHNAPSFPEMKGPTKETVINSAFLGDWQTCPPHRKQWSYRQIRSDK